MLTSKFPMFVAWGPQLNFLYNDSYRPILGAKHPQALGLPFQQVWSEIWAELDPLVSKALAGEATFREDLHLVMERNGYPEDTWYTFSYSPVLDEAGGIGGMFCACTETTHEVKARAAARGETERLRELFQQAPGFMAVLRGPNFVFELVNEAYLQLVGHRRDIVGQPAREALPEIEGQGFFELLNGVYRTGKPFVGRNMRVGLQRTPGSPVEGRFVDLVYQPITDSEGKVTGIFAEGYDVTERVEAEAALRASEERFRTALNIETVGVLFINSDGGITDANDAFLRMTGYTRDDLEAGRLRWDELTPPEFMPASLRCAEELMTTGQSAPYEKEYIRKDGSRVWLMFAPRMLTDKEAVEFVLDISERKRSEEHQQLLIHELNHRVKNTLATVQALASRAFKDHGHGDAQETFEARLFALAHAHDMLTRENWDGAELSSLIAQAITPYGGVEGGRFEITGPKLRLNPQMALAIAMALHELATNATKYGALSVPSGRVAVTWTVTGGDPAHLTFRWQEKDGPLVTLPTRQGFGSRLIKRSLSHELGGEVQVTYEPTGVVCLISAPLTKRMASTERETKAVA
jgi:PAS domain S-box-containing protein